MSEIVELRKSPVGSYILRHNKVVVCTKNLWEGITDG